MDSLPRVTRNLSSTAPNDDVTGRSGGGTAGGGTGSRRPSATSAVFFQRSTSYGTDGDRRPTRADTLQSGSAGVQLTRTRALTAATGRMVGGGADKDAGLLEERSLFIFSEENFVRKYAKIIIEWGYPLTESIIDIISSSPLVFNRSSGDVFGYLRAYMYCST